MYKGQAQRFEEPAANKTKNRKKLLEEPASNKKKHWKTLMKNRKKLREGPAANSKNNRKKLLEEPSVNDNYSLPTMYKGKAQRLQEQMINQNNKPLNKPAEPVTSEFTQKLFKNKVYGRHIASAIASGEPVVTIKSNVFNNILIWKRRKDERNKAELQKKKQLENYSRQMELHRRNPDHPAPKMPEAPKKKRTPTQILRSRRNNKKRKNEANRRATDISES